MVCLTLMSPRSIKAIPSISARLYRPQPVFPLVRASDLTVQQNISALTKPTRKLTMCHTYL